jgi:hypothetical protein
MPVPVTSSTSLQKLIRGHLWTMILEYLIIVRRTDHCTILIFPETLQCQIYATSRWLALPVRQNLDYSTHNCCGPRHALSFHGPPIYLLPSKYSSPMAFIYAPTGNACDRLYLRCPQL